MFDTLHSASQQVSVMMLTVELKKISDTPVNFLVMSKQVSLAGLQSCILSTAISPI